MVTIRDTAWTPAERTTPDRDLPARAAALADLMRGRRTAVITGAMLVFAVSAAATALAPTYAVALASRVLGAAAVGLLWSTVNAHVAELVPDRHLARATAVVLGGGTLGLVLGTPVGRFVADLAAALTELTSDPARAAAMGAAGRARAEEQFSWDSIAERTLAVYRGVLGQ